MSRLRKFFQHRLNPLHVYCRLRDCRFPKPLARCLSAVWEVFFTRPKTALAGLAVLVALASCAVPAQAKHLHKERVYQESWCTGQGGTMEVGLPGGLRVDCLTATHAVEFDFAPKWAEAIGQSVAYAAATGKRAGIVLILERPADSRHLETLRNVITSAGLPIDLWTMTPEEVAR